jgi:predicted glycosyltransferase
MKTVLIDINHPAHVHLFRHFITEMKSRGNEVIVTAKNVDSITNLLKLYNINYIDTGRKKDHILKKYLYEFFHLIKVLSIVIHRRVDYGIGVSMVLPIVSRLTPMKSFALDDDDLAATPIFGKFTSYADVILNPNALAHEKRGSRQLVHPSYHELAYLHPNRFVPDPGVLSEIGLKPGEPFFVLRFNAFKAHHDAGAQGLTTDQKIEIINFLKYFGKIFITTERDIEPALKSYQLPVSPEKIHTLLYYATLFIGDSQTMTSEAALLGTPAVKLNSFAGRLSIPNELEHTYQLCYSFLPQNFEAMMHKIKELVLNNDIKAEWRVRKEAMLADKVDLTSFLTALVINYPFSVANSKPDIAFR